MSNYLAYFSVDVIKYPWPKFTIALANISEQKMFRVIDFAPFRQ